MNYTRQLIRLRNLMAAEQPFELRGLDIFYMDACSGGQADWERFTGGNPIRIQPGVLENLRVDGDYNWQHIWFILHALLPRATYEGMKLEFDGILTDFHRTQRHMTPAQQLVTAKRTIYKHVPWLAPSYYMQPGTSRRRLTINTHQTPGDLSDLASMHNYTTDEYDANVLAWLRRWEGQLTRGERSGESIVEEFRARYPDPRIEVARRGLRQLAEDIANGTI